MVVPSKLARQSGTLGGSCGGAESADAAARPATLTIVGASLAPNYNYRLRGKYYPHLRTVQGRCSPSGGDPGTSEGGERRDNDGREAQKGDESRVNTQAGALV